MSISYVVHTLDPKFLAVLNAHEELAEAWLGDDRGIEPDAFRSYVKERGIADDLGVVRSTDDGESLEQALPAIAFILGKLKPEARALCALEDPRLREFKGESGTRYALDPALVTELAGLLESVELEDFAAGYDPAELTRSKVHPNHWREETAEDEVVDGFEALRNAAVDAAAQEAGLLIAMG